MGELKGSLLTLGALALCTSGCSMLDGAEPDSLPFRDTPQAEAPYSESDPTAPLRGTAVAIEVATP